MYWTNFFLPFFDEESKDEAPFFLLLLTVVSTKTNSICNKCTFEYLPQ
jgi:hypothetical protein